MKKCVICGEQTDDKHKFDEGDPWPCCDDCYEDYQIEHGDIVEVANEN